MKTSLELALFVHTIDQVGGAEVATRRWADRLVKRGHDVTLIGSQPLSQWSKQRNLIETERGLRIVRLPVWHRSRKIFETMLVAEISVALLFFRKTELLHIRAFAQHSMSIAATAKRLGMKVICGPMASGPYGDIATLPKSVSPEAANGFDWVSCMTEAVREEIIHWGYPAERTSVIPNGVDTNLFLPTSELPHPQSAVFVGQFRPEKRIDLVLDAWQMIQVEYPEARLTLVGGKTGGSDYETLARSMGLNTEFLPILPALGVLEQLRQHAVFIMSGVSEGMSNALLEGMSTGLAPIVSNTPGNQAVVTNGVNGLTYESDSAAALAESLRYVFSHPSNRQLLAQQARETVIQNFSLDSVVDRYLRLYDQILAI